LALPGDFSAVLPSIVVDEVGAVFLLERGGGGLADEYDFKRCGRAGFGIEMRTISTN